MKQELTEDVHLDNLRRIVAEKRVVASLEFNWLNESLIPFLKDLDERVQLHCLLNAKSTSTIEGDTLRFEFTVVRVEDPEEQKAIIEQADSLSHYKKTVEKENAA